MYRGTRQVAAFTAAIDNLLASRHSVPHWHPLRKFLHDLIRHTLLTYKAPTAENAKKLALLQEDFRKHAAFWCMTKIGKQHPNDSIMC